MLRPASWLPLASALLYFMMPIPSQATPAASTCSKITIEATKFFEKENELLRRRYRKEFLAAYEYNTNLTEVNRKAMIAASSEKAAMNKELAQKIKAAEYADMDDELLKRQAKKLTDLGADVLDAKDYEALQEAISAMQANYATVKVCSYTQPNECDLALEPHIQERFSKSRDPKELEHYWRAFYDAAGTPMRENFTNYVRLTRKAANLNNYASYADYWLHFYEDPEFEKNLDAAYNAILPFYREIHAYVRHRLRNHYGDAVVLETGNIPMHLLGNLWAQQWDEAIELYTPYPDKPFTDVTAEMQKQGYTIKKMFELGDEFFKSLGMLPLPDSFWELSMLERPTDRNVVCHASAWDLYKDKDVRIKMCTEVNMHYLYVVHHELGHIQYYLQYGHQPTVFRGAPNPGFHEAVGDVIALSVATPRHLKRIGLMDNEELDQQSRINELFKNALKKIVFLPFAYTMDKYRYAVFRGDVDESKWNSAFWQMRSNFTGVEPPVVRSDNDFDPTAKYHVDADVEYLRYFAAHIFQFQFYKAMCRQAGQYEPNNPKKPLDNCDVFNSKAAGEAFSKMLAQGSSRHWKEVLQEFTGETKMDPSALLEYFAPLHAWLQAENKRLNVPMGWSDTTKVATNCSSPAKCEYF